MSENGSDLDKIVTLRRRTHFWSFFLCWFWITFYFENTRNMGMSRGRRIWNNPPPPTFPESSITAKHIKAWGGGGGWFLKVDDFHLFLNLNERVGYSLTTRGRWDWSLRSLIKAQGTGKSLTRDEWNTLLPHAHSHGMGIDQSSLSVLVQGILSTSATSTSSSAVSECSQPCEAAPKLKKSPHWCAWSRM